MACSRPDQDRYLMMSLILPRAKPSTLHAGHAPAATPHTQSPASTHAAGVFFAVLPDCPRLAAHSHHTGIAPYAVISCDLGDRRRDSIAIVLAAAAGGPPPDFVAWRFRTPAWRTWFASSSRRPKTCTAPDACTAAFCVQLVVIWCRVSWSCRLVNCQAQPV